MENFLIIAAVIVFLGVVALAYMGYKTRKAERDIIEKYNSKNRSQRRKVDKAYRKAKQNGR